MSKLTVLVFKDQLASRSFELTPRWLTWFGVMNLTLGLIAVGGVTWGVKNWMRLRTAAPSYPELEQRIEQLQGEVLSAKSKAATTVAEAPAAPTAQTALTPERPIQTGWARLSSKLLAPVQGGEPTIKIENVRIKPQRAGVRVQFELTYVRKDGGTQQGRFLILGRSADALATYPKSLLQSSTASDFIQIDRAESFSVGRLRPVDARIEGISTAQEIEILIIDRDGRVLQYETRNITETTPNATSP